MFWVILTKELWSKISIHLLSCLCPPDECQSNILPFSALFLVSFSSWEKYGFYAEFSTPRLYWTLRLCILTPRYLSNPRWVNSNCRWTRKFMFSTEWTTMLMNCMQATWKRTQWPDVNSPKHPQFTVSQCGVDTFVDVPWSQCCCHHWWSTPSASQSGSFLCSPGKQ